MDRVEMVKILAEMFRSFADGLLASIETAETTTQQKDDSVPWKEYTSIVEAEKTDAQTAPKPEQKQITLEEVRAAMAAQSRAGHTAECRALLKKHGASRLSEVDPKEYPALLTEVEAL